MKIADRYLLKEMLWPFVGGLAAFVVMLTGHMLFQAVEVMVDHRVSFASVLQYVSYQVPMAAAMALPVSTLLAVGLGINRLASDTELMALRVAGMSRRRLLLPGLFVGVVAMLISLLLYDSVAPWAEGQADMLIRNIAFSRRALLVRPGEFIKPGHGVTFLVDDSYADGTALTNARIFYDMPDGFPLLYSAASARFSNDTIFIDYGAFYHLTPKDDLTWGNISGLGIPLASVGTAISGASYKLEAMSFRTLLTEAAQRKEQDISGARQYIIQLHWRVAFATSCFFFALIAGPIVGAFGHRQNLVGLLATLLIVFVYYVLMLWLRMLVDAGTLPTFGVYGLNLFIGLVALVLIWRQK